jgi:epoxyqueuosine reductase
MNPTDLVNARKSKENMAKFLDKSIKDFVNNSYLNVMLPFNNQPIFLEPVVVFADGENADFQNIKQTVASYHLTPREVLENVRKGPVALKKNATPRTPLPSLPGAKPMKLDESSLEYVSVICGALPINPIITQSEGRTSGSSPMHKFTSAVGGHNGLTKTLAIYVENLLLVLGYIAVEPYFAPWFGSDWGRVGESCRTTQSNWSERHVAEICGLGTFGLHGQIITPKGSAAYLFSIVTNAPIAPTPKSSRQNCLYYREGTCMECVSRCPGGAISEKGRNPTKCHLGAKTTVEKTASLMHQLGPFEPMLGGRSACGQCFSNVPCSSKIPD